MEINLFTAFFQLFTENIGTHPDPADRKTDQQRLGNAGQRPKPLADT